MPRNRSPLSVSLLLRSWRRLNSKPTHPTGRDTFLPKLRLRLPSYSCVCFPAQASFDLPSECNASQSHARWRVLDGCPGISEPPVRRIGPKNWPYYSPQLAPEKDLCCNARTGCVGRCSGLTASGVGYRETLVLFVEFYENSGRNFLDALVHI